MSFFSDMFITDRFFSAQRVSVKTKQKIEIFSTVFDSQEFASDGN